MSRGERGWAWGYAALAALVIWVVWWKLRDSPAGDIDPLSAVIAGTGLVFSVVATVLAVRAWRWQETDTTALSARLAVEVARSEGLVRQQLLGRHDKPIDIDFTFVRASGHAAAQAAPRDLVDTYRLSVVSARALVTDARDLPVIDGLDEMAADAAPGFASRTGVAVQILNAYQQRRAKAEIVVTCRSEQHQALTAAQAQILDAAQVQIGSVTVARPGRSSTPGCSRVHHPGGALACHATVAPAVLARALAIGLTAAVHAGRYRWEGTFRVGHAIDRAGWDVLTAAAAGKSDAPAEQMS